MGYLDHSLQPRNDLLLNSATAFGSLFSLSLYGAVKDKKKTFTHNSYDVVASSFSCHVFFCFSFFQLSGVKRVCCFMWIRLCLRVLRACVCVFKKHQRSLWHVFWLPAAIFKHSRRPRWWRKREKEEEELTYLADRKNRPKMQQWKTAGGPIGRDWWLVATVFVCHSDQSTGAVF